MYFYLGNTIEVSEHSSEIRDLCGEPELMSSPITVLRIII